MTARVLLVRHGAHDLLGRVLCGRGAEVSLNAQGMAQAARLAAAFVGAGVAAVYASPLARARQTAAPIAAACGLEVCVEPSLTEIDVGGWTGLSFEALGADPRWAAWNSDRLHHRPPGGESMLEAQVRVAGWLAGIGAGPYDQTIVAVSHSDVIKAACCHALGLSVDASGRFDVDPASVTTLLAGPWGFRVQGLNQL